MDELYTATRTGLDNETGEKVPLPPEDIGPIVADRHYLPRDPRPYDERIDAVLAQIDPGRRAQFH